MPDGTTGIVEAFARATPGVDGVSIAEAVWLAAVMPSGPTVQDIDSTADSHEGAVGSEADDSAPTDAEDVFEPAKDGAPHMFDAPGGSGSGPTVSQAAIAVGRALPSSLELARALRPFKRRWPRGRRSHLDLDATVEAYARTGKLLPVLGPAPERWLEAAVVVDSGASMVPWEETADEFLKLLDHTGAFRAVRRWDLVTTEDDDLVIHNLAGQQTTPRALVAPDSRRLIIVLSDASSPFWRNAEIWSALRMWALSGPTAIVNPLPPRLWRRTGMNFPATRAVSRAPARAGRELSFEPPSYPEPTGDESYPWMPIPVVSLAPPAVARWARSVMNFGSGSCDVLLVPDGGRTSREIEGDARPQPQPSVARRLAGFLMTAPEAAIRLAALCSPFQQISFPLLTLLRQVVGAGVSTADVAEVVLSGLFTVERVDGGPPVLYLHEEARAGLAARLSKRKVWEAYEAVSRFVEESKALPGRFPVTVDDPQGTAVISTGSQPFAAASRDLLVVLGMVPVGEEPSAPRPRMGVPAAVVERPGSVDLVKSRRRERTDEGRVFYVSYAHTPRKGGRRRPDPLVSEFFHDLHERVRRLMPREPRLSAISGEGAFAERPIEVLAACRVFVPLYSPYYFTSEDCGKEWSVFLRRRAVHVAYGRVEPEPIIPVLWMPIDHDALPRVARSVQFGDLSGPVGVSGLMRSPQFRSEYELLVGRLADQIVAVAARDPVPALETVDIQTVTSAFTDDSACLPVYIIVVSASMTSLLSAFSGPLTRLRSSLGAESSIAGLINMSVICFNSGDTPAAMDLRSSTDLPLNVEFAEVPEQRSVFDLARQRVETDVARLVSRGRRIERPLLFFLMDGDPADPDWEAAFDRLVEGPWPERPQVVAFGIGDAHGDVVMKLSTAGAFIADRGLDPERALADVFTVITDCLLATARQGRLNLSLGTRGLRFLPAVRRE